MVAYWLLLGLPVSTSFLSYAPRIKTKKRKIVLIIFFSAFFFLLVLRGFEVGTDLSNYIYLFYLAKDTPWSSILTTSNLTNEIGFTILEKICIQICGGVFSKNSFRFFLMVVSLICVLPLYKLYKNESDNELLSIALFVGVAPFTLFFSGLREAIAISLGTIAWSKLSNKKIVQYLIFVLLAFSFHQSAILLILMLPFSLFKIKKTWLIPIFFLFTIVFLFRIQIFSFFVRFMPKYDERYGSDIVDTGAYGTLLLLLTFLIFCFYIPDEKLMDRKSFLLRNLIVLMIFIQCFASINRTVMRINYYYLVFIPVLIPKIIDASKSSNKNLARLGSILMVLFFFFFFLYIGYNGNNILHVFPYVPYWESEYHHDYPFIDLIFN